MVLLVEVFASRLTSEFFTIPITKAKQGLKGAQQMIQQLSQPTQFHVTFSKWLVLGLKSLVDSTSKPQGINKEKLCFIKKPHRIILPAIGKSLLQQLV